MLIAWRLCAAKWASSALSGHGAFLYGGRWNSKGTRIVYTAGSLALAQLEMRVQLRPTNAPTDHVAIEIGIPDDVVAFLDVSTLPRNWRAYPAPGALARFGDQWSETASSAALAVPSAVVPEERNILLNPEHPDFLGVVTKAARPVVYDSRLFSTQPSAGDRP